MQSRCLASRFLRFLLSVVLLALILVIGRATGPQPATFQDMPGNAAPEGRAGVSPGGTQATRLDTPGGLANQFPASRLPQSPTSSGHVILGRSVKNDVSPPISSIPPLLPVKGAIEKEREQPQASRPGTRPIVKDPVVQNWLGPLAMPTPALNFEG